MHKKNKYLDKAISNFLIRSKSENKLEKHIREVKAAGDWLGEMLLYDAKMFRIFNRNIEYFRGFNYRNKNLKRTWRGENK